MLCFADIELTITQDMKRLMASLRRGRILRQCFRLCVQASKDLCAASRTSNHGEVSLADEHNFESFAATLFACHSEQVFRRANKMKTTPTYPRDVTIPLPLFNKFSPWNQSIDTLKPAADSERQMLTTFHILREYSWEPLASDYECLVGRFENGDDALSDDCPGTQEDFKTKVAASTTRARPES